MSPDSWPRPTQPAAGSATNPRRILGWVYVGRLALATALLIRASAPDSTAVDPVIAAVLVGLTLTVTGVSYLISHRREPPLPPFFAHAQAIYDALLLTAVVYATGGAQSIFTPVYILVITAGTLILPILPGVVIGWLSSGLYLAVAIPDVGGPDAGVLLQGALFAIVAIVTAYLGDRLRRTGAALGEVETELRRLRLDTDDILDTIGTGILTIDEGRLAYLNPAAVEILSLDPADWLDLPIIEELDRIAPGLGAVIERTAETGQPIRRFETEPVDDEEGFVLGVSTTLLERETGRPPPVTAIFQDITEKVKAEGLRRRAERLEAVAELSASLAHEIKNPLASIRSAVEQIAGAKVDADDARVLGALIVRESDRLSRLLGEFIDFARVKVTAPQPVEFGALVQGVVDVVRAHPDASERGVEITFEPPEQPVLIQGAEDLLHRAILNLALNASQWAGEGGRVELSLDEVRSDLLSPALGAFRLVRLAVRDTGPGVPDDIRDHIFDPFFTRRKGGTGLGLALVQRAVEAHGGAIFVDDAPAGERGAIFSLYLPSLPADAVAEESRASAVREDT